MAKKWKTIRVFISSTFRDMHAERDHLVRFVFPELIDKCRKHHVHLIDVDLRWGVSEKDAEDGKALDICLDEIDSCRPFFLPRFRIYLGTKNVLLTLTPFSIF